MQVSLSHVLGIKICNRLLLWIKKDGKTVCQRLGKYLWYTSVNLSNFFSFSAFQSDTGNDLIFKKRSEVPSLSCSLYFFRFRSQWFTTFHFHIITQNHTDPSQVPNRSFCFLNCWSSYRLFILPFKHDRSEKNPKQTNLNS